MCPPLARSQGFSKVGLEGRVALILGGARPSPGLALSGKNLAGEVGDGRGAFRGRSREQVEMELEARAEGPQFPFGSGDDRLGKGARVAHRHHPKTAGVVTYGGQHDGVAKRWAV